MIAYKLVRKRKDQTYGPLFINPRLRIELNRTYLAEDHPTKGFAHRPGWHCTSKPEAPHLSLKGRVWLEVEIPDDSPRFERPQNQGGLWFLAPQIKFIKELT